VGHAVRPSNVVSTAAKVVIASDVDECATWHPSRHGHPVSPDDARGGCDGLRTGGAAVSERELGALLAAATVDPAVHELRPDYVALLVAAGSVPGGASDEASDGWLREAEAAATEQMAGSPPEEREHVALWREAFRAFGAKPQRTRNSLEALLRRVPDGLPRINRLTDLYNAVSVLHEVPIGGEDLDGYVGPARLIRAAGNEPFETTADGAPAIEHPDPGEVVWADDAGVTCRRWNWRQCSRTQLSPTTTRALFIIDALGPDARATATGAGDDLERRLRALDPAVTTARRLLARATG
jgi:DNA/RNA-binding domain of Phe-tRNA-synthetase-like protein